MSMTFLSLILHPISLVTSQVIITALAISFTRPSSIITRLAALPLLIIATWLVALTCLQRIPRISFASLVAGNGPTYLLRYIDLVLLSRWDYETQGPTNSSQPRNQDKWENAVSRSGGGGSSTSRGGRNKTHPQGTALDRLRFGIHVTFSSRHIGTPWEVKNVPHFSASDPRYLPSQGTFLRRTAFAILLCYLVIDVSSFGVNPESNAVLFASQNVPFFARLGDVSTQQLAIRIFSSLTLFLNIYCVARLGYSIIGTIAVGTGLSQVSAWRPPFGRLADAYTVRRFWGNFWHQMFRQPFSSLADFLVHDVLRLTNHRLAARYSKILATFLVSGLLHLAVDLALGMSLSESGSVRFFGTQAIGIALEDGVQAIYRAVQSGKGPHPRAWTKTLGYIWVVAFLAWSTPVWVYPAIRINQGGAKDRILPFSVLRLLFGRE